MERRKTSGYRSGRGGGTADRGGCMQIAADCTVYFDGRGRNYKSRFRGFIGTKLRELDPLQETRGDGSC